MKGVRALLSGMLVLAAICVVPAVSVAQESGTPADTTATTTTTPDPATPPAGPGTAPAKPPSKEPGGSGDSQDSQQPSQTLSETPQAPVTTTVSGPGAKAHSSSSSSVNMGDFFFSPATITVDAGDTVTWHNSGQAPHTATANDGSFDTGTINSGGSGSHTFSSAGTFSYICTIHPNMHGTVRVLSAGGSGGGGASSSSSGTSESSAVASPDAAGTSTTLPMTGLAVGALALTGFALLASGLLARWAGSARRWLSLF